MIEGYIGRPGAGKTYTIVERAIREANRGRDVFCNFPIEHPRCYQFGPDELLDLPAGLVVVDEAHLWFPARQSLQLPPSWLAKMSQTRKSGWDILWSAQHEKRVDAVVRDVSNWMWLCRAWLSWEGHPLLFEAQCYEPEFFRNPKRQMGRTMRMFSKRVASAYDTFGSLTVAQHAQRKNDVYAKASASKKKTATTRRRAS